MAPWTQQWVGLRSCGLQQRRQPWQYRHLHRSKALASAFLQEASAYVSRLQNRENAQFMDIMGLQKREKAQFTGIDIMELKSCNHIDLSHVNS